MSDDGAEAAGIPPLGVKPNLINPSSLYPQILSTVLLCTILTTIFTFARLFTKFVISAWALEDHLLTLAWAFNIAYDYLFLVQGKSGWVERHIWDTQLSNLSNMAKSAVRMPTIWLAKSALLFQLQRIFAPTKTGSVFWATHVLIWTNLAFYVSTMFTVIFQCVPIYRVWQLEGKDGHCINFDVAALATGSANVISDLLILLLPLMAIWRLQMAPKRKLGVSAVFVTGLLAFASSICRLAYTTKFFTSHDVTYITAQIGMWTLAETATLILVTCFPVMPRFGQLVISKISHSQDSISRPFYRLRKIVPQSSSSEAWTRSGNSTNLSKNTYIPLPEEQEHGYSALQVIKRNDRQNRPGNY